MGQGEGRAWRDNLKCICWLSHDGDFLSSFVYRCSNRNDADAWNKMVAIKSKILSLWDIAPIGVRICCIKFVQRVILVQSRGITDPRVWNPVLA